MSEKKFVRRSVAIGLGTICVIVVAGLVGAFAYYHYTPIISDKDATLSFLNSEINQLNSTLLSLQEQAGADNFTIDSLKANIAYLQDQLNELLNATILPIAIITSNPSAWVNRTVVVESNLSAVGFPALEQSPWSYQLSSDGQTVGVSLSASVNTNSSFWYQVAHFSPSARIYGVVEKGEITTTGNMLPPEDTYYIEAEIVEPL